MTLQKIEINAQTALEIATHEAILTTAYKDSRKVWTWSVGITSASGHTVERYVDNPSTLDEALAVWVWLMQTKYAPDVLKAFEGVELTREQFTAAMCFHWNTGKIKTASWVGMFKAGKIKEARDAFMWYDQPKEIIGRRKAERDLFFDGKWSNDGKISYITKVDANYRPVWASTKKIDITEQLKKLLGEVAPVVDAPAVEPVLTTSPATDMPQVVTPTKRSYNLADAWRSFNLWLIRVFG